MATRGTRSKAGDAEKAKEKAKGKAIGWLRSRPMTFLCVAMNAAIENLYLSNVSIMNDPQVEIRSSFSVLSVWTRRTERTLGLPRRAWS